VIDLHPASLTVSYALGISGSKQVGYGYNVENFESHALMWSGSPESVVDLNPLGYSESFANGVSGEFQAGYGYGASTNLSSHALLWNGTAGSAVDLNPIDFTESYANAIAGGSQVGSGLGDATDGMMHALLWTGSSTSYVDLHPDLFDLSQAWGVSTFGQVGDGSGSPTNGNNHALYWNGTAESVVDLHSNLPNTGPTFVSSSAKAIAANGTIVGSATDDNFVTYAVLWTPSEDSGVLGDYDNNGTVDAADYIAWRKGNNPLYNEAATIGSNTFDDYNAWRERFGNTDQTATSVAPTTVPESASILEFMVCLLGVHRFRRFQK
jgi:hypothetical protein